MLSERRLEVLRAIVQDYVGTEEPVGSKALTERHALGVSPATVRNDMAVLEEEGFIAQPHTSAGRVEQRMVDCPAPFGEAALADLRARLNARVVGRRFADVPQLVQDLPESFEPEDRGTVSTVLATLLETLVEETEERLMIGGTA